MKKKAEKLKKRIIKKFTDVDRVSIIEDEEGIYLGIEFKETSHSEDIYITLNEETISFTSFCGSGDEYAYLRIDEAVNSINNALRFAKLERNFEYVFAFYTAVYMEPVFEEMSLLIFEKYLSDVKEARKRFEKIYAIKE